MVFDLNMGKSLSIGLEREKHLQFEMFKSAHSVFEIFYESLLSALHVICCHCPMSLTKKLFGIQEVRPYSAQRYREGQCTRACIK